MSSGLITVSENSTPIWERASVDLLKEASSLKATGITLYNENQISDAFYNFSAALKLLIIRETAAELPDEQNEKLSKNMKLSCYLNLAACQLKVSHADESKWERLNLHVVDNCTIVLSIDHRNVKGLFRRGTAYYNLKNYEKAQVDISAVLCEEPGNRAAMDLLKNIKEKLKTD